MIPRPASIHSQNLPVQAPLRVPGTQQRYRTLEILQDVFHLRHKSAIPDSDFDIASSQLQRGYKTPSTKVLGKGRLTMILRL